MMLIPGYFGRKTKHWHVITQQQQNHQLPFQILFTNLRTTALKVRTHDSSACMSITCNITCNIMRNFKVSPHGITHNFPKYNKDGLILCLCCVRYCTQCRINSQFFFVLSLNCNITIMQFTRKYVTHKNLTKWISSSRARYVNSLLKVVLKSRKGQGETTISMLDAAKTWIAIILT